MARVTCRNNFKHFLEHQKMEKMKFDFEKVSLCNPLDNSAQRAWITRLTLQAMRIFWDPSKLICDDCKCRSDQPPTTPACMCVSGHLSVFWCYLYIILICLWISSFDMCRKNLECFWFTPRSDLGHVVVYRDH